MKKSKNPFNRLLKMYLSGQIAEDVWTKLTSKLDRKGVSQQERLALVKSFNQTQRLW